MKVLCIANKKVNLAKELQEGDYHCPIEFNIDIGEIYTVYALTTFYNSVWFCIYYGTFCPMWQPASLFKIIDNKLSRHWRFSIRDNSTKLGNPFLSFPEWVEQEDFYDELTEGAEKEKKIFFSYKQLMDLEFPDDRIVDKAQIGDEKWLICPYCIDAWEGDNKLDGMVVCPKCMRILHNPRFIV